MDDPSAVHGRKAIIALAHAHARLVTATAAARVAAGVQEQDSDEDSFPQASSWWAQRTPHASLLSPDGAYVHGQMVAMLSAVCGSAGAGGGGRALTATYTQEHQRAHTHPYIHTHTYLYLYTQAPTNAQTHTSRYSSPPLPPRPMQGVRARQVEDAFGTSRAMRGYPGVLCTLLAVLCPSRDNSNWRSDSTPLLVRQAALLLWCGGGPTGPLDFLTSSLPLRTPRRLVAAPTIAEEACGDPKMLNTLGRCMHAAWKGQDAHTAYALCGALRAMCLAPSVLEKMDHPVAQCAEAVFALKTLAEAGADLALDYEATPPPPAAVHTAAIGHSASEGGAPLAASTARARCAVFAAEALFCMVRVWGWKGYAKAQSQPRLFAAAQVPELTSADSLWSPGDRALLMGRLWAAHAARGAEAALLDQAVQLRRAMAAPSEHAASTRHAPPPRPRAGRLASRLSADATEPSGADRVAAAAEKTMPSSFLDVRAARSGAAGTGLWRIALRQPASDRAEERSKQAEVRAGICGGRSCRV